MDHVLARIREHLERVGGFELVGGALEMHHVVVVQVVEHAAQVLGRPRMRRADAADDHGVDATRFARQHVLGHDVPHIRG